MIQTIVSFMEGGAAMSYEEIIEALGNSYCPFTIEVREGTCNPPTYLVTLKTNRFHWLTRVLVNLAMKGGMDG